MNAYQMKNSVTAGSYNLFAVLVATIALWAGTGPVTQATMLGMTVLEDNFNDGDLAGWTSTPVASPPTPGGWLNDGTYAASYNYDGSAPNGTLTRPLSTTVTGDWSVELRYGWYYGNNSTGARDVFSMLDSSGNGYLVYLEESGGALRCAIQRETAYGYGGAGVDFTKPFADNGIADGGALTPIALDWTASTGTLNLYFGNPGDPAGSVSPIPVATMTDTTYTSFSQFQFQDAGGGGSSYRSLVDDIVITTVPEPTSIALVAFAAGFILIRRRSVRTM